MQYKISGQNGFIGSALKKELDKIMTEGDHPDYLFHFGSPSSQRLFDEDYHCISETIEGFVKACEYAKRHRCKLVFPSSSTVYDAQLPYGYTKLALESIVRAYNIDYLALRIYAGYGPGEKHKRNYASPIYQFASSMVKGQRPTVYGDGTQTRDFVYIDDIVKTIIDNVNKTGIIDIGTGNSYSFNEIISMINSHLNKNIRSLYVEKPVKYIDDTVCKNPIKESTPIYQGIYQVIRSIV